MRLLVFGRSGQVARELAALAGRQGVAATLLGRNDLDLSGPGAADEIAASVAGGWDAVINAAAYTAVDAAEDHEDEARRLNEDAPAVIARAAAAHRIPMVHLSTDYVFDGSGTAPWTPEARPAPLSVYGRTKLAGEEGIREAGGIAAIIRTSWVFSAHGRNFVRTMLRLSESRDRLDIVADQVGGPTPARDLAAACIAVAAALRADPTRSGTYHLSGAPEVSWAGFARAILSAAGRTTQVTDIPSADYPTPAARPLNSRLDCSGAEQVFGIARPDWRVGLERVLHELRRNGTA